MKKIIIATLFLINSLFAFESITTEDFDAKVKNKKVILDFYASWCPPCKIISKQLTIYDKSKKEDIHIFKVNIDAQRELLQRFDVKSIPTLVYLKDGQPVFKEVGVRNNKEIAENVQKYLH